MPSSNLICSIVLNIIVCDIARLHGESRRISTQIIDFIFRIILYSISACVTITIDVVTQSRRTSQPMYKRFAIVASQPQICPIRAYQWVGNGHHPVDDIIFDQVITRLAFFHGDCHPIRITKDNGNHSIYNPIIDKLCAIRECTVVVVAGGIRRFVYACITNGFNIVVGHKFPIA